ncbi:hypothetical protein [uncultured Sphingomonas sp.]|uniref:hypothetical protein n=1 Tax=uncultured Sphingomonas sp. TaxID=158754 RepID=UPI0025F7624D|nr:hypothetical protein [uncultured Sphingomonas sp.]
MTSAACGLLRALVARAGNDRILLSDWTTIDWHSLTFSGEKHHAGLVFSGTDAPARVDRWAGGLAEADLDLGTSGFLAEIALAAPPRTRDDGSVLVEVEALTIAD